MATPLCQWPLRLPTWKWLNFCRPTQAPKPRRPRLPTEPGEPGRQSSSPGKQQGQRLLSPTSCLPSALHPSRPLQTFRGHDSQPYWYSRALANIPLGLIRIWQVANENQNSVCQSEKDRWHGNRVLVTENSKVFLLQDKSRGVEVSSEAHIATLRALNLDQARSTNYAIISQRVIFYHLQLLYFCQISHHQGWIFIMDPHYLFCIALCLYSVSSVPCAHAGYSLINDSPVFQHEGLAVGYRQVSFNECIVM